MPAQVSAMMGQVQREFGGLDILVNNAGIVKDRTLKKMSSEEWESVLRVKAFHLEPKVRASRALEDAFDRALARLARALGIERVER